MGKINYNKIFLNLFLFLAIILQGQSLANTITKTIKENDFDLRSTISIYAANFDTNKVIYKKNEKKLLNPASSLKALTFGASYLTLGKDYKFETTLYKDKNNNLYIKLGADPLLSSLDLKELISNYKGSVNLIFIDDTIINKTPYPSGWMAEDMWPKYPALSPYIIDRNKAKITLRPSSLASKIDIIQQDDYKFSIINQLKLGQKNEYEIENVYGENSSIISFKGTISKDETKILPVIDTAKNFKIKLKKALEKNKIVYTKEFYIKKVPNDATKIASVWHDMKDVSKDILHYSDNYVSEIVFKVAGAKYNNYKEQGSTYDGLRMFKETFSDEFNKSEDTIQITDASGVSRNDLVTTVFITNCLCKLLKNEDYKELFPTANVGTLKDRLPFLENNLKAKTGTLNGVSTISGVMKSKKNTPIIFSIIIQNSPKRTAILKNFENQIIGLLYKEY